MSVYEQQWQTQGKSAKVIKVIGGKLTPLLGPFIMLDFFKVKLPAGFPDHPHRGFETVSYLLEGSILHQDFRGHRGRIDPGDVQWMTAGKGIVHSQIPSSQEKFSIGFQLWINLLAKDKGKPPSYQEFVKESIQAHIQDKLQVKLIAGNWKGKTGPVDARTPAYFFDVSIQAGGQFALPIPGDWNTVIFVYDGQLLFQEKHRVQLYQFVVLQKSNEDEELQHVFKSEKGAKFVLIGGKPLGEPICSKSFWIMNTQEEVVQARQDWKNGANGFEGLLNGVRRQEIQ